MEPAPTLHEKSPRAVEKAPERPASSRISTQESKASSFSSNKNRSRSHRSSAYKKAALIAIAGGDGSAPLIPLRSSSILLSDHLEQVLNDQQRPSISSLTTSSLFGCNSQNGASGSSYTVPASPLDDPSRSGNVFVSNTGQSRSPTAGQIHCQPQANLTAEEFSLPYIRNVGVKDHSVTPFLDPQTLPSSLLNHYDSSDSGGEVLEAGSGKGSGNDTPFKKYNSAGRFNKTSRSSLKPTPTSIRKIARSNSSSSLDEESGTVANTRIRSKPNVMRKASRPSFLSSGTVSAKAEALLASKEVGRRDQTDFVNIQQSTSAGYDNAGYDNVGDFHLQASRTFNGSPTFQETAQHFLSSPSSSSDLGRFDRLAKRYSKETGGTGSETGGDISDVLPTVTKDPTRRTATVERFYTESQSYKQQAKSESILRNEVLSSVSPVDHAEHDMVHSQTALKALHSTGFASEEAYGACSLSPESSFIGSTCTSTPSKLAKSVGEGADLTPYPSSSLSGLMQLNKGTKEENSATLKTSEHNISQQSAKTDEATPLGRPSATSSVPSLSGSLTADKSRNSLSEKVVDERLSESESTGEARLQRADVNNKLHVSSAGFGVPKLYFPLPPSHKGQSTKSAPARSNDSRAFISQSSTKIYFPAPPSKAEESPRRISAAVASQPHPSASPQMTPQTTPQTQSSSSFMSRSSSRATSTSSHNSDLYTPRSSIIGPSGYGNEEYKRKMFSNISSSRAPDSSLRHDGRMTSVRSMHLTAYPSHASSLNLGHKDVEDEYDELDAMVNAQDRSRSVREITTDSPRASRKAPVFPFRKPPFASTLAWQEAEQERMLEMEHFSADSGTDKDGQTTPQVAHSLIPGPLNSDHSIEHLQTTVFAIAKSPLATLPAISKSQPIENTNTDLTGKEDYLDQDSIRNHVRALSSLSVSSGMSNYLSAEQENYASETKTSETIMPVNTRFPQALHEAKQAAPLLFTSAEPPVNLSFFPLALADFEPLLVQDQSLAPIGEDVESDRQESIGSHQTKNLRGNINPKGLSVSTSSSDYPTHRDTVVNVITSSDADSSEIEKKTIGQSAHVSTPDGRPVFVPVAPRTPLTPLTFAPPGPAVMRVAAAQSARSIESYPNGLYTHSNSSAASTTHSNNSPGGSPYSLSSKRRNGSLGSRIKDGIQLFGNRDRTASSANSFHTGNMLDGVDVLRDADQFSQTGSSRSLNFPRPPMQNPLKIAIRKKSIGFGAGIGSDTMTRGDLSAKLEAQATERSEKLSSERVLPSPQVQKLDGIMEAFQREEKERLQAIGEKMRSAPVQ